MIFSSIALSLASLANPPAVKNYGQQLVDESIRRHPEVLVLMMHVSPSEGAENVVVASNIGRIGKPADADDLRVISTGAMNREVSADGRRFEVELPLHDVSGLTVGALGVVLPYVAGDNEDELAASAVAIRDELGDRISSAPNLVESYPFDPRATTKAHAQKVVDSILAAHSDLLIMALHVTPPDSAENIIVASNIGRIGKVADADDLGVISSGLPHYEVNAAGNRFEAELPLLDGSGATIGAVGLVYSYGAGSDQGALAAKALVVQGELRSLGLTPAILATLDP